MKLSTNAKEAGATGYILLWLLGIPLPILFLIFLLRGCTWDKDEGRRIIHFVLLDSWLIVSGVITNTDLMVWTISGLVALGIGWSKYAKYKTRDRMVRDFAAMDPERREKVLSRLQPDLQMEIRQELMKRYRLKTDVWRNRPPFLSQIAMSVAIFEMNVSVLPSDIDEQKHVNNTVYLRWVQEVAIAHWKSLASAEAQELIGWVVLRHEIDYKTAASLGDEILLRTWVGEASRLKFERLTEVRRKTRPRETGYGGQVDNELLARARTLWVPIDSKTGKPTRVSAEVREKFSV
jgi:acyl-CoA thioester hydrolase